MSVSRGRPPGLASGNNGSTSFHCSSVRSVGYGFLSIPEFYGKTAFGTASKWGGGVYDSTGSTTTLINCTISGNRAGGSGGGMYNYGAVALLDCTVSGNV